MHSGGEGARASRRDDGVEEAFEDARPLAGISLDRSSIELHEGRCGVRAEDRASEAAYSGSSNQSRTISSETSRWNCTPYAFAKRSLVERPATARAGRRHREDRRYRHAIAASRAPSGRQARTGSARPSAVSSTGSRPTSGAPAVDPCPKARSEQLNAEADAEEGRAGADGVRDQPLLGVSHGSSPWS